jgi:hypothetical protein
VRSPHRAQEGAENGCLPRAASEAEKTANHSRQSPQRVSVRTRSVICWQIAGKRRFGALRACKRPGTGPGLGCWFGVEPPAGIEPATPSLPWLTGNYSLHPRRMGFRERSPIIRRQPREYRWQHRGDPWRSFVRPPDPSAGLLLPGCCPSVPTACGERIGRWSRTLRLPITSRSAPVQQVPPRPVLAAHVSGPVH